MTHEQAFERLDDFVSGELPDLERIRVQRHVEACDECGAEVEALRALLADVAALPSGIAPPTELWAGIAARLEPKVAVLPVAPEETKVIPLVPRQRPWQPPRWTLQIAAALVLVVGSSLVTKKVVEDRQPAGPIAMNPVNARRVVNPAAPGTQPEQGTQVAATDGTQQQGTQTIAPARAETASPGAGVRMARQQGTQAAPVTALAAFRPAEREYQRAIDDLVRVLDTRRGQMKPETVETLERNLRIIDQAIAESRAALEKDPNSRELTQMLSATYDAKVQALRQAVEL